MKAALRTFLFSLALAAGGAFAHGDDKGDYTLRSLNAPDPIFVSGDSVQIRVSAGSSAAIGRAGVRLNGDDVTSAFSPSEEGAMTGTVVGLRRASIRSSSSGRRGTGTTRSPPRRWPGPRRRALACNAASFPASALPVPNTVVTSVAPVAATATVPAHCLVNGTINAGRVGNEPAPAPRHALHLCDHLAGAPAGRLEQQVLHAGRRRHRRQRAEHDRAACARATRPRPTIPATAMRSTPIRSPAARASFGTDFLARSRFRLQRDRRHHAHRQARWSSMYYGERPKYSYFEGCSMGGREAMMVTQRFPSYFDGVVSGDPAFRITKVGVWATYAGQQLARAGAHAGPDLRLRRAVRQQHLHQPGPAARLERGARGLRRASTAWSTAWCTIRRHAPRVASSRC